MALQDTVITPISVLILQEASHWPILKKVLESAANAGAFKYGHDVKREKTRKVLMLQDVVTL